MKKCRFFSVLALSSVLGVATLFGVVNNKAEVGADAAGYAAGSTMFVRVSGGTSGWLTAGAKLKINIHDTADKWHNFLLTDSMKVDVLKDGGSSDIFYKVDLSTEYTASTIQILRMDNTGDNQWNYSNSVDVTNANNNLMSLSQSISDNSGFSVSSASISNVSVGEAENGTAALYVAGTTENPVSGYVYSDWWFDLVATPADGYRFAKWQVNGEDFSSGGATNPVTLEGISGNCVFTPVFEEDVAYENVSFYVTDERNFFAGACYAYAYNSGNTEVRNADWPGVKLEANEEWDNTWDVTLSEQYDTVIFNNGYAAGEPVEENIQMQNVSFVGHDDEFVIFDKMNSSGETGHYIWASNPITDYGISFGEDAELLTLNLEPAGGNYVAEYHAQIEVEDDMEIGFNHGENVIDSSITIKEGDNNVYLDGGTLYIRNGGTVDVYLEHVTDSTYALWVSGYQASYSATVGEDDVTLVKAAETPEGYKAVYSANIGVIGDDTEVVINKDSVAVDNESIAIADGANAYKDVEGAIRVHNKPYSDATLTFSIKEDGTYELSISGRHSSSNYVVSGDVMYIYASYDSVDYSDGKDVYVYFFDDYYGVSENAWSQKAQKVNGADGVVYELFVPKDEETVAAWTSAIIVTVPANTEFAGWSTEGIAQTNDVVLNGVPTVQMTSATSASAVESAFTATSRAYCYANYYLGSMTCDGAGVNNPEGFDADALLAEYNAILDNSAKEAIVAAIEAASADYGDDRLAEFAYRYYTVVKNHGSDYDFLEVFYVGGVLKSGITLHNDNNPFANDSSVSLIITIAVSSLSLLSLAALVANKKKRLSK